MADKFTKGPWSYAPEERDGEPVERPNFFTIHAPHYFADVHVLVFEPDSTRAEADARLIAAAPAMLAALRELVGQRDAHFHTRAAWDAARAAIAAATGGE